MHENITKLLLENIRGIELEGNQTELVIGRGE